MRLRTKGEIPACTLWGINAGMTTLQPFDRLSRLRDRYEEYR